MYTKKTLQLKTQQAVWPIIIYSSSFMIEIFLALQFEKT